MKPIIPVIAAIAALALGACAGRVATPVAVVQTADSYMTCEAIVAEIASNNSNLQDLAGEQGAKVVQNTVFGVAGFALPIFWLGLDVQPAATREMRALSHRQQRLSYLMVEKRCESKK